MTPSVEAFDVACVVRDEPADQAASNDLDLSITFTAPIYLAAQLGPGHTILEL